MSMAISQRQLEFCQQTGPEFEHSFGLSGSEVFMDGLLNSSVLPDKDVSTGDYERRLFQYKKTAYFAGEDDELYETLRGSRMNWFRSSRARVNRRVVDAL